MVPCCRPTRRPAMYSRLKPISILMVFRFCQLSRCAKKDNAEIFWKCLRVKRRLRLLHKSSPTNLNLIARAAAMQKVSATAIVVQLAHHVIRMLPAVQRRLVLMARLVDQHVLPVHISLHLLRCRSVQQQNVSSQSMFIALQCSKHCQSNSVASPSAHLRAASKQCAMRSKFRTINFVKMASLRFHPTV